MSFLRIEALLALPLVLLPILIHLIHRRKHPTVPWAAMMFLQRVTESRRGGAKVKRWLVLTVRTIVIAAILFALSRPLSSGVFGLAASRVANDSVTIVIVDRSVSMQRRVASGETRLLAGLLAIEQTLSTLGTQQVVLVDSVSEQPIKLESVSSLSSSYVVAGSDSSADMPAMLLAALDYLKTEDLRLADLWICSDRSLVDWEADSIRWKEIDRTKAELGEGVRFHLVDFADDDRVNRSVRVERIRWSAVNGGEVLLDIIVDQDDGGSGSVSVQVMMEELSRSVDVPITNGQGTADEIRIAVGQDAIQAIVDGDLLYGQVSLPADVNAADDHFYFSVDRRNDRPIGLVTEADCIALHSISDVLGRVIQPAGSGSTGSFVGETQLSDSEAFLSSVALLVWQGTLPNDRDAAAIDRFLQGGGSVVFFPAQSDPGASEFSEVHWTRWRRTDRFDVTLDAWEFAVSSFCPLEGELVHVATVSQNGTSGEDVFIGKKRIGRGTVFFCGADVLDSSSEFARNGLALYALIQEAIDASELFQRPELGWTASRETHKSLLKWQDRTMGVKVLLPESQASRSEFVLGSELGHHAGVYRLSSVQRDRNNGRDDVAVVNRPAIESRNNQIEMDQLTTLVPSIEWNQVKLDSASTHSGRGLVQELWGAIWILVIVGMVVEAWLTLPPRGSGERP